MKYPLLAAAVLAALPGFALADNNVELYGAVGVMVENVSAKGATNAAQDVSGRMRVHDMSSRIGFRGKEDLGDGLSAIFQIEQATRVDDGSSTAWASRNSFIGLKGGFGTIKLGRHDTPYKDIGGDLDVLGTSQFSPIDGTFSRFERRASNIAFYESPAFSGFKAKLAYTPDEAKGALDSNGNSLNQQTYGASLEYAANGLGLAAGFERRDDVRAVIASGATAGDASTGIKLVAQYAQGPWFVGGGFERIDVSPNSGTDLSQDGWLLTGSYALVPGLKLAASVTSVGELDGNANAADYKATQVSLGATYDLSKRTRGFLYYTRIDNKAAQSLNFSFGKLAGVGAGSNPVAFGAGLRHKF